MSCYEWERGTIRMSASELGKVHRAMVQAQTPILLDAFDLTQAFWKRGLTAAQRRSLREYTAAVFLFLEPRLNDPRQDQRDRTQVAQDLLWAAGPREHTKRLARRVLRKDLNLPTNRTTVFHMYCGSVTFDRSENTVEWAVDGNRAVDEARDSLLGRTFWTAIDQARFGRGHGGIGAGNNEYASESYEPGGGANYETFAVGPVGKAANPHGFQPYYDSKGQRIAPPRVPTGRWY